MNRFELLHLVLQKVVIASESLVGLFVVLDRAFLAFTGLLELLAFEYCLLVLILQPQEAFSIKCFVIVHCCGNFLSSVGVFLC